MSCSTRASEGCPLAAASGGSVGCSAVRLTCLLSGDHHHTQGPDRGRRGWRGEPLVPVRQVEGVGVDVQALHQRPGGWGVGVRQAWQEDVGFHSFNMGGVMVWRRWWFSPGQLQESVLAVLFLGVGGLTVVLVKVGRHCPRLSATGHGYYEWLHGIQLYYGLKVSIMN